MRESIPFSNNKRVTIRDVAQKAGVAISSVSRALGDHPNVSSELRARVEAAARELGYQPDFLAHSLRRGTTRSIGFLVGNISNPVIADISASATNLLSAQSYAMLLVCSQNNPAADESYLRFLDRRQVSGLIISSAADGPDRTAPLVAKFGLPTVMLDRDALELDHVSAVQSDHFGGMQAAVSHLLDQGHQRIALVGALEHIFPACQRLLGFKAAFHSAGIEYDPSLIRSVGFTPQKAYLATHSLLSLSPPPSALIAAGNTTLLGVLQALKERDVAVGRDLALIGCDDTALARLYPPGITVIARDLTLLGETAASLLLDMLGQGDSQTVVVPTQLIIRKSSRCSPRAG